MSAPLRTLVERHKTTGATGSHVPGTAVVASGGLMRPSFDGLDDLDAPLPDEVSLGDDMGFEEPEFASFGEGEGF